MIEKGRYSFYGITNINVIDIKHEDGDTHYFIQPDVNPEGWWVTADNMKRIYKDFNLLYVGPYIPIQPKTYLKEFRFSVD
jgi:hypothetical protein